MKTIQDIVKMNGHTVGSISPDSSVIDAFKQMSRQQVDVLPVLAAGKLVGILTEIDCINKVIIGGRSTEKTQVWEVMAINGTVANLDQSAKECLDLMNEKHTQHLPVVSNGSLVGIVSTGDILRTIMNDQEETIYRLDNYVLGIDFGK